MPSILSQKQDMAAYYGTKAVYAFMATGDPGTGTTVANEAAGGSPAYVRLPIPWGAPDSSATIRAVVTFDLPPGLYTYAGLRVGGVGRNAHLLPAASHAVQPHRAGRLHADLYVPVHGRLSRSAPAAR
jgi:hypothetical protein